MNIREKALEFATKAHEGQKRKDGKDYITHPIAVAESVEDIAMKYGVENQIYLDDLYVLSLIHDVAEDTDITFEYIKQIFGEYISETLDYLTKRDGENYFDFISRIGGSDDILAMIVKLADLEHNMSDLNEGSMKDKYRFAHYYLTQAIEDW